MRRLRLLALLALAPLGCDPNSSSSSPPPQGSGFDAGTFDPGTVDGGGVTPDGGVVNECPKPSGGPTVHESASVTGDETWTAAASPHVLPYGVTISGTLTLEPCAEVLVGGTKAIAVNATGKLVAEGLANKPIHIGASDATKPFSRIYAGGGGTMRLAYATVDDGGDPENTIPDVAAMIYAQGSDQYAASQPTVFVDHVTVAGSKSDGLFLADGAGFAPGSRDLTVTGAAQYPVSLWARAIGTLPSGTYTGNAIDEIVIPGSGGASSVQEDATIHDFGVPYRIGDSTTFGNLVIERQAPSSPGLATLTIDAGVTLRFKKGGVVHVQRFTGSAPANGALVVNGTAAKPVVFTSAEAAPAAGDWLGIWFGEVPSATDKIDHARIEYAGGVSSSGSNACNAPGLNDAAIRIYGPPASAFVTNTTITNSAGHGIDRGWRDDIRTSFLATNTFVAIAQCRESYPKDTNGGCPASVPCP